MVLAPGGTPCPPVSAVLRRDPRVRRWGRSAARGRALESFLVGEVTYREAELDDAAQASDVMSAAYPPMQQDPVMTRFRWENLRQGFSAGRFIAERDGRPIAFLAWLHGPWSRLPERHCEVEVWLDRQVMDRALLRSMWSWIGERAEGDGALLLLAYAAEDELEALDALAELGYTRERAEKVWELDLKKHGPRLVEEAAEARAAMSRVGIRLLTVAEWEDPAKRRKLHELDEQTRQDVPHSLPIIPETLADFEKRLRAPDR